jgi:tetratricopeptide (TPR) repeat protein
MVHVPDPKTSDPSVSASLSTFTSLLDNHALSLLNEGKLDEALQAAVTAVAAARQSIEDEPETMPKLFHALQILGDVEREVGDIPAAEASYGEALDVANRTEISKADLARVRTQLATLLDFSQRENDAIPLYEQAINDYEGMSPPETEIAAQMRNNLAMIYKGNGKYALAEQHYLRSLETLEAARGRQSEEVASVYNNLGSLYYTAGFADQAKEMFSEALEIRLKLLGPDDPDVAQSHCNLATAAHELGDNAASMQHFENSLRILERHIKDEAASYEAVGMDYVSLLESLGEERKAAALKKRMEKVLADL